MLLVEVSGFEEWLPLLVIRCVNCVDGIALFEDIWDERLLVMVTFSTKVICIVSLDCNEAAPVQILELLLDLVL